MHCTQKGDKIAIKNISSSVDVVAEVDLLAFEWFIERFLQHSSRWQILHEKLFWMSLHPHIKSKVIETSSEKTFFYFSRSIKISIRSVCEELVEMLRGSSKLFFFGRRKNNYFCFWLSHKLIFLYGFFLQIVVCLLAGFFECDKKNCKTFLHALNEEFFFSKKMSCSLGGGCNEV